MKRYQLAYNETHFSNDVEISEQKKLIFFSEQELQDYINGLYYIMDMNKGIYDDIKINDINY